MYPSTFSIAAYDPRTEAFGVAVQSKFLAVGSVVPWAQAGTGAIATQAWANTSYGPEGLGLLAEGLGAREVVERLTAKDPERKSRQLGIVDAKGRAFAFTGDACLDWAGSTSGDGFTCQGNILAGPEVTAEMARAYRTTEGTFEDRLVAALEAGQAAGGDRRGKQSAALLVARAQGGYSGFNDRAIDLRVDDHPDPIPELRRILNLHTLHFGVMNPADAVALEGPVRDEVATHLGKLGLLHDGISFEAAFAAFLSTENFETRNPGPGQIDRPVLVFLRNKAGAL